MVSKILAATVLLLTLPSHAAADAIAPLSTVAERSGFKQTGRYDEVIALCDAFAKTYPDTVQCIEFGRTPEGRPLLALIAAHDNAFTPELARERKRTVLMIQGGIHPGEIDGKDAGFLALRELLDGTAAKGALDKLTLVFVPVFNVDGHERFGRWNRPNQRGPEEMGWRTTAQNYNLNRDYVKADAPEMQAMLRLIGTWDPTVYVDLHVTDGAKFEHDISITIEPVYSGDAALRKAGLAMRTALIDKLATQGSLPVAFYPSFVTSDDPASGFADGVPTPRFSNGYTALRNRFGVLVETHSWKDYATRVRSTRNTIVDLLEMTASNGSRWRGLSVDADARAKKLGGTSVPLTYAASSKSRTIDFRGYAYTRTPSEISGALMTRYDETTPQIWKIPLRDDVQPATSVIAPTGGYVVPAAYSSWVSKALALHGIVYESLGATVPQAAVETFRADKVSFSPAPFENHATLTLEGSWKPEARDIGAGSLFVPIAQAKSRLVVAMFEPKAPDSFAAWGEFNSAFEQKEYMEDYVAEEVARDMLASDPALARQFADKLAADPAFATDPRARLGFFARRHSSWDERLNLYPVMRVAKAL